MHAGSRRGAGGMTADLAREGQATAPVAKAEAGHRVHPPGLPACKPSKLVMPVTALGLWLVVDQLNGLGELRGSFDL